MPAYPIAHSAERSRNLQNGFGPQLVEARRLQSTARNMMKRMASSSKSRSRRLRLRSLLEPEGPRRDEAIVLSTMKDRKPADEGDKS